MKKSEVRRRYAKGALPALAVVLLSACAGLPYQAYTGPRLGQDQEASISSEMLADGPLQPLETAFVTCVDGVSTGLIFARTYTNWLYYPTDVVLTPGHHHISLGFQSLSMTVAGATRLEFDAEASHHYVARMKVFSENVGSSLHTIKYQMWLEDSATSLPAGKLDANPPSSTFGGCK